MFARVSTFDWKPERLEDGISNFKEQILPWVQKNNAGFRKGYLMVDRKKSKVVALYLFDTEKDAEAITTAADKVRAQQGTQTSGFTKPPIVEIFEVPVQV